VTEFLAFPFFQRALLAGFVVAVVCGALSFFVVLRRLAFVGSGVSHAAFGGVALAALVGVPPGLGALLAALAVALATAKASGDGDLSEDTAVGVFTVAGWRRRRRDQLPRDERRPLRPHVREHPDGRPADLLALVAASALVVVLLASTSGRSSSPRSTKDGAFAAGVNVARMRLLVLVLLALTVVVALKVVGILLVSALLVLPGAVARALFSRWPGFLLGSVAAALVMVLGGLLLSVALDVPSGAAIILTGTLLFLAAVAVGRLRRNA
jgi:ABC-type Mn2+/Zn2+ transport systems, permease components